MRCMWNMQGHLTGSNIDCRWLGWKMMKNGQKNVTTKTDELIQIADQSQMCVFIKLTRAANKCRRRGTEVRGWEKITRKINLAFNGVLLLLLCYHWTWIGRWKRSPESSSFKNHRYNHYKNMRTKRNCPFHVVRFVYGGEYVVVENGLVHGVVNVHGY